MAGFTPKQGQYLAFIHQYTVLHRRPPAEVDMQKHFGVTPPSVHQMILTLERKKLIRRRPGEARSVQVAIPISELPVLGSLESEVAGPATKKGERGRGKAREPGTRWPNVDWLIRGNGDVTLGSVGSIRCAATAADAHTALTMLVRRRGESLEALLTRLDEAIRQALEDEVYTDEING